MIRYLCTFNPNLTPSIKIFVILTADLTPVSSLRAAYFAAWQSPANCFQRNCRWVRHAGDCFGKQRLAMTAGIRFLAKKNLHPDQEWRLTYNAG